MFDGKSIEIYLDYLKGMQPGDKTFGDSFLLQCNMQGKT